MQCGDQLLLLINVHMLINTLLLVSMRVDNSNEKLLHPPGTSFAPLPLLRRHTEPPQVGSGQGRLEMGLVAANRQQGGLLIDGDEADNFSSTFAETPFCK